MTPALHSTDVKLIKTFLAVAESGGLSAAQVKLNRSLTAISSDLQALETRLGSKLCRRGRSGFALTEFGVQVYEASRVLFKALNRFQQDILPSRDHLKGALRLAVNEGQTSDPDFVLAEALRRFCNRPKNLVKVGIVVASFEQILEGLLNDEVDVGLGFFRFDHPRLDQFPLYEERNLLYCGRHHPLFAVADAALTAELVLEHPVVLRAPRPPDYYPPALGNVSAAAIGKTPGSRSYLILSGRYLGYLAEHQAEHWVAAGLMRAVLPDAFQFNTTMVLAVRSASEQLQHIALFLKDFFAALQDRGVAVAGPPPRAAPRALTERRR
jgi:DNA-binding transcriptional LysR family regulator